MAEVNGGYIFVARKIQQSDIWRKPAEWLKVWIYLLQEVNHNDHKVFKRGTNFFNYQDIARSCLIRYPTVDNCLRWLKSTGQITTEKTTRGVIIKVLNYAKYQDSINYQNDKENGTKSDLITKQKRNGTDTINKNDKNVITKEGSEATSVALTPKDTSQAFFSDDPEVREQIIRRYAAEGKNESWVRREVDKFRDYWTEPNKSGTKFRWQMEKTFEVGRRLSTWLSRSRDFNRDQSISTVSTPIALPVEDISEEQQAENLRELDKIRSQFFKPKK